jgi:Sensors of blue-light using FAD
MYHLVYISYAVNPLREEDLVDILTTSRLYNKKNKVTGMLVYLRERFIQVLEGEYEVVNTIYKKIKEDPRHRRVTVVLEGNTRQRIFKDWSMGFKKLDDHQFQELSGFNDPDEFFNKAHVTDKSPAVMIFLSHFYKKNINDYPEAVALD